MTDTFLVLLAVFGAGMVVNSNASVFLGIMLGAVVTAGATGALVRAAVWAGGGGDPIRSLVLGAIAGFVVGLAYLVPQLVGGPELLSLQEAVKPADKIQLISVMLIALSAGVGFDAVFRRLRDNAAELPVMPQK